MGNFPSNKIYCFGNNESHQLGIPIRKKSDVIVQVPTLASWLSEDYSILDVAGGDRHTLFLCKKNRKTFLYSVGSGSFGQLGNGKLTGVTRPNLVSLFANKNIIKIAAGRDHSLALTDEGRVYSWGRGQDGQLGHGNLLLYSMPREIEALAKTGIIDISCGENTSAAVSALGRVFTWGGGAMAMGILGHGQDPDRPVPHIVEGLPKDIVEISCGASHFLALSESGRVYSWGSNSDGQLGNGTYDPSAEPKEVLFGLEDGEQDIRIISIFAHNNFSACISTTGLLYTFGNQGLFKSNKPVCFKLEAAGSSARVLSVSANYDDEVYILTESRKLFRINRKGVSAVALKGIIPNQIFSFYNSNFIVSGEPSLESVVVDEESIGLPQEAFYEVFRVNAEKKDDSAGIDIVNGLGIDLRRGKGAKLPRALKKKIYLNLKKSDKIDYIDIDAVLAKKRRRASEEEKKRRKREEERKRKEEEERKRKEEEERKRREEEERKRKEEEEKKRKEEEERRRKLEEDSDYEPEEFICPLSFEIFRDPVICSDGFTYERKFIEEWLRDHDKSPITNHRLPDKTLIPNKALKQQIMNSKWAKFSEAPL